MREAELRRVDYDVRERSEYLNSLEQFLVAIGFLRVTGFEPIRPAPRSSRLRPRWPRDHALSLAYFSKTSRVYSACITFREICPFRSLAIFKRSGSVGARDFRLNLAKNLVAGPGVLPNRRSNNPIVTSLVRDMFREPLYCALGTDGPQHRGISRDVCRHPRRCNRDAGRQSTSAARFIAGLFGFFTLTQCRHRPPR